MLESINQKTVARITMPSLYSRILLTASLMLYGSSSCIYAKDSPPSAQNIVGGIAIKVNNDPITLYEIQSLSAKQHSCLTSRKPHATLLLI